MDCPKCKTPNPDDAKFCTLCYENLVAKPSSGPVLAFNETTTNIGKWTALGPVMVREDGFYFFLKQFFDREKAAMRAAGGQGGLVGALVVAGIESMAGEDGPPGQAVKQKTSTIADFFQKALDDAPEIVSCEYFFKIPKQDITGISFDFLSALSMKTTGETLKVSGMAPKDKVAGFLRLRGYPVE
ncbi:MAG TPA: hypothetical protein DCM05_17220 [Elusimicrobia bacterium]|nr:hypothetical protein [Elusimicrobiota bacterium]